MKLNSIQELLLQHFTKASSIVTQRTGNIFYSYDRVSSKDQMVNGNSLVWQFERIDEFANHLRIFLLLKRYSYS